MIPGIISAFSNHCTVSFRIIYKVYIYKYIQTHIRQLQLLSKIKLLVWNVHAMECFAINNNNNNRRRRESKTSLVAQWRGVYPPTQETGPTPDPGRSHKLQLLNPAHRSAPALQPKPRHREAHTRKACTASRGQQSQK